MNLRLFALLTLINVELVIGRKIYFYEDYLYSCLMIPDSFRYFERHADGREDNDVKKAEFNGTLNSLTHLTLSDFPVCQRFKNLKEVKISNEIKNLDENLLQDCGNLEVVFISNAEIEEIPKNFFSGNPKLTWIYLHGTNLITLGENTFKNQKNLETLMMSDHQLSSLPANIFKSLVNLEKLVIQVNKLKIMNPVWFECLENLEELYLTKNEFSELPKDVFKPLKNLQFLSIGSNFLKVIHSDSFGIHNKLTEIDLTNNEIVAIDERIVDKTAVRWLDMTGNICSQAEAFVRDEIKEKIKKCIENY